MDFQAERDELAKLAAEDKAYQLEQQLLRAGEDKEKALEEARIEAAA